MEEMAFAALRCKTPPIFFFDEDSQAFRRKPAITLWRGV
jgi:hypothetical protein